MEATRQDELTAAIDERLFELNGKLVFARIDLRPGEMPEGVLAWERDPAPIPLVPFVSHRVYFREEADRSMRAILESGRYDLTREAAIEDAQERARM